MVFQRYGGGGLHNCGPNPCLEGYLSHDPPIGALDLSYMYSKVDLPRIKQMLKKRAFVYLGNFPTDPEEAIEAYRQIMELHDAGRDRRPAFDRSLEVRTSQSLSPDAGDCR